MKLKGNKKKNLAHDNLITLLHRYEILVMLGRFVIQEIMLQGKSGLI